MRTGRPKVELLLSDEKRSQLQSFARSRSLPAALSTRAGIVLSRADGTPNNAIAERLKLTKATVGKWRNRGNRHPDHSARSDSGRNGGACTKTEHSMGIATRFQRREFVRSSGTSTAC